jgi:DNA-binding NtrC family response regulator
MPKMRSFLRDVLAPGHEVVLAPDGMVAHAKLERERFAVVVTDAAVPGPNGFELLRLIKARWPLTEVVITTAAPSVPSAVEAIRLGAYDYVQKPVNPDDLRLIVDGAVERHLERASAPPRPPPEQVPAREPAPPIVSYREALAGARERGLREYLASLLKAFDGNVSRAAEQAGLERESLHRLLRRYGVHPNEFRNV